MNKLTQVVTTMEPTDLSLSVKPTCFPMRFRLQQQRSPIIIGISGDSGSGKTTYCNEILRLLGLDMDLSTTYMGLKLRSPLVVGGAAPLTQNIDDIKRMEDVGVAAVVLPCLSKGDGSLRSLTA